MMSVTASSLEKNAARRPKVACSPVGKDVPGRFRSILMRYVVGPLSRTLASHLFGYVENDLAAARLLSRQQLNIQYRLRIGTHA